MRLIFFKYARRYLSEFSYRSNRRFHLKGLPVRLLVACATTGDLALSGGSDWRLKIGTNQVDFYQRVL